MSTLQISLAIIGGLVLAIVVAHSAWSARKNTPKQADPDPVAAAPTEPGGDISPQLEAERQEPGFDPEASLDAALTALTVPEKKPGLDALIDVIAPIVIDSVVSGEAALAAMPGSRRAGSKPFAIEGLSLANGSWETPAAGQRYSAFQAGVQLANRTGALNQIEFSEFVMKAQAFADAIDGQPEFPDMMDEVARARELDGFASAHDAQLSFTLRAKNTAWSPGYVHQSAAKQGFVAGSIPGRMVLPASDGSHHAPILGLAFDTQAAMAEEPEQTALRELTLSLDVPQVLRDEQPFVRMCEAAIALATSMDGVIIDDQGQAIRPEAMEAIHADLEKLYDTLEGRDMPAGSALGRRLFS
ncbi:MAG: cell division protein ZipA C-terminal FtsZ-binding domain-containing protein [Polaromonas sp.]|nr:cell division protein ZipA C-terminal FtsZ-binding domain-containing protein [Polaromonas sp.]